MFNKVIKCCFVLIFGSIVAQSHMPDSQVDFGLISSKGIKTSPNIKQKHFSAAIFIDRSNEINSNEDGAIRRSVEIFMYKQIAPMIVCRGHLLSNIFDIHNAVLMHENDGITKAFFSELERLFLDFDKNWMVFRFNGSFNFLIIPRKYIEYFFNLNLSNIEVSLLSALYELCNCGDLRSIDRKPYKNLREVFKACGFDGYIDKFKPVFYKDISELKIDEDDIDICDFYYEVSHIFTEVLCQAGKNNKWYLYFDGHGSSNAKNEWNSVCGFHIEDFLSLFKKVCKNDAEWICLSSCFLGGKSREFLQEAAVELKKTKMCPNLAILSPTDSPSYGACLWGGASKYYLNFAKKYEQFLFEFIKEGKFSKYPYSVCCNGMIGASFFKGESVIDAIVNSVIEIRDKTGGIILSSSSWPLLLNSNFEPKFLPLEDQRYSFRISSRKVKFDDTLKINGQKLVFIEVPFIKNIEIEKNVPFIISGESGQASYLIDTINVNLDLDFKTVMNKMFVDEYFQVACCKEFFINVLRLKNSEYLNVYVKQYFNKKENNENGCYIIEFKWFDKKIQRFYGSAYKYNDKDGRTYDNEKKDKWVEIYSRVMTKEEVETYKLFFEKEELQVVKLASRGE